MAEIQLTYGEETSFEQILGFEMASAWWSNILEDDVDIYIHVDGTDDLPDNVVGGALASIEDNEKYEEIQKHLERDITSSADATAIAHLPEDKEFSIVANGDSDLRKTDKMRLTRANAKALDMENSGNDKLDGYIVVNDLSAQGEYTWDYALDRNAEFSEGNLDFFSVAVHEVGHILGFVSGVDDMEWLDTIAYEHNKQADDDDDDDDDDEFRISFKDDAMKFSTPLDLYRFSEGSASEGKRDFAVGHNTYFSIDGGQEKLAEFSTGKDDSLGGDGFQASHWKHDEQAIGIMDPVLFTNQRREISNLDSLALDVIGWDINSEGLAFNLEQLQHQAETQLAQKLGITSEHLHTEGHALIDYIKEDRYKDVEKMLKDSDVYEWGSRRRSRRGSRWQEVYDLLEDEGKYQTFDQIIDSPLPTEDNEWEATETNQMHPIPGGDITGAPGAFIPDTEEPQAAIAIPESVTDSTPPSGPVATPPTASSYGTSFNTVGGTETGDSSHFNSWQSYGSSFQTQQSEISQLFQSLLEDLFSDEPLLHSGIRLLRMF